jgi:site-specific DNA-methyltransferase (adenine-specific)
MSNINLHLGDCLEAMKEMPDNTYDLAIVDPPYGIGWDKDNLEQYNSKSCDAWKGRKPKGYTKKDWDSKTPSKEYFNQLNRVSKNQIIWGGNYFNLKPTGGWIVWDKGVVMPTFSDGEMAWQSLSNSMKIIKLLWAGYRKCEETSRIHPTQKPVKLYEWLLDNYAKEGDKILDTHLGSGSIALACHNRKFDLDAWEIDQEYYNNANKRLEQHMAQTTLF